MSFSPRPRQSHAATLRTVVRVVLVALLLGAGLAGVGGAPGATADESAPQAARTWIVDAVDDDQGARWVSRDTGTDTVTIQAGDTVEWRFEWGTAEQGHDLTSKDTASTWNPPVAQYRAPGDPPVSYTFTEAGTYDYECSIHGDTMSGTVVVEDAAGETNQPPTAQPVVDPRTGTAPLSVHFTANGEDPDGDPLTYEWDFGTADDASDQATSDHAMYEYRTPGSHTAILRVSDGRGGVYTEEFTITVDGAGDAPLVNATATPASGAAPLAVAFSAEVTTTGRFSAFADGMTTNPDLTGSAAMVRRRGQTYAALDVTGVDANRNHMVHVHEEPCASNRGGAHFRFDESQPFSEENEIWLPFHSDAAGRSGLVEKTQPLRAGPDAVSIVIHDPDNPALRIGCADLVPSTHDYTYAWDFGDGTTGVGPDPDHTYARAGSYTATLRVTDGNGGTVTDTVAITVAEGHVHQPPPGPPPSDTAAPQTGITGGPTGTVRSDDATFSLTSSEALSTFSCSLDGGTWQGCPSPVTFRGLAQGRHRLEARATDGAGNHDATPAVRVWTVDSTGPRIRQVRPSSATSDCTPTIGARVVDGLSGVRPRSIRLSIDGRRVGKVRYAARRDKVTGTSRLLAPGRHVVRLVALDAVGNRSVKRWRFRVVR